MTEMPLATVFHYDRVPTRDAKRNAVTTRLAITIDVLSIKLLWAFGVVEMLEHDGDAVRGGQHALLRMEIFGLNSSLES